MAQVEPIVSSRLILTDSVTLSGWITLAWVFATGGEAHMEDVRTQEEVDDLIRMMREAGREFEVDDRRKDSYRRRQRRETDAT